MPTATLTFDLDKPDQHEAHARCVKATELALCLWDLDQWLRSMTRSESVAEDRRASYQYVRDHMHEIMDSRGVWLEELLS